MKSAFKFKEKLTNGLIHFSLKTIAFAGAKIAPFCIQKNIQRLKGIHYGTEDFGRSPLGDPSKKVLDVYFPKDDPKKSPITEVKPLPIAILIHGGGFRYFSKESHAAVASGLAAYGMIVFVIDYSLTPKYPYPAGLLDSLEAYHWVLKNAEAMGGDLNLISLVGESAGANFVLALCLYFFGVTSFGPEIPTPPLPMIKPKNAVVHCGHLQVTRWERYLKAGEKNGLVATRVRMIQKNYLPESLKDPKKEWAMADPLLEMEKLALSGGRLPAAFPEVFVPVGSEDPILGDSERLAKALEILGQKDRLKIYSGAGHAFYAAPFFAQAKECWEDIAHHLLARPKTRA